MEGLVSEASTSARKLATIVAYLLLIDSTHGNYTNDERCISSWKVFINMINRNREKLELCRDF